MDRMALTGQQGYSNGGSGGGFRSSSGDTMEVVRFWLKLGSDSGCKVVVIEVAG